MTKYTVAAALQWALAAGLALTVMKTNEPWLIALNTLLMMSNIVLAYLNGAQK